jgi:hypothetical protein
VLHLHGGGFTTGSPATHRALATHLAAASGATVHVLDYRLAPEHPFPAALDDVLAPTGSFWAGVRHPPGLPPVTMHVGSGEILLGGHLGADGTTSVAG